MTYFDIKFWRRRTPISSRARRIPLKSQPKHIESCEMLLHPETLARPSVLRLRHQWGSRRDANILILEKTY